MPATAVKYGIFGTGTAEVDENGFIDVPVIIQESGHFVGIPPAELRIHSMGVYGDDEFNKAYVAKLNRCTDLPFYLATAKVRVTGPLEKYTDQDLEKLGIEPLKDI